jgi:hypothetical protein
LSFQYARSTAWLDELTPEREPHCYDLCEQHAGRLTPPSGWRLEDRRMRVVASDSDEQVTAGTETDVAPAAEGLLFGSGNRLAG